MSEQNLGRLEKKELRSVWTNESGEFTPWLGQPENLKLLGEAIGIDLELEAQEKEVGPFRADLLCKDTATDNWVLVENQLTKTDHSHLGQILTYAAGLEAVSIVWIAEHFTEEHRATLDWLNERTDEKINLFGLEIELWRIGDSSIAPKFNIISKPNDWTRTIQKAAAGDISEHKRTQLQFWTAFKEYMEANSKIRCQKPAPQHWMNHSIGKSGFHMNSIASMWNSETNTNDPEIRVELVLDGKNSKQQYAILEKKRQEIEGAIGFPLKWHNPEDKNTCRIYTRINADFLDNHLWPQQHEWLRKNLEIFQKVFAPIIKALD
jgi:hypothetical protein